MSKPENYLGLTSMVERKKLTFNDVKLRVLSKISNWQAKMFSRGGKGMLIKVVPQAILAYVIITFKLPIEL